MIMMHLDRTAGGFLMVAASSFMVLCGVIVMAIVSM